MVLWPASVHIMVLWPASVHIMVLWPASVHIMVLWPASVHIMVLWPASVHIMVLWPASVHIQDLSSIMAPHTTQCINQSSHSCALPVSCLPQVQDSLRGAGLCGEECDVPVNP